MKDDPLVEEARQAGRDYLASFNGDWDAMVADLRRRTEAARAAGEPVGVFPPRRLDTLSDPAHHVPAKAVG